MKVVHALAYVAETAAAVAIGVTVAGVALAGVIVRARKRLLRGR